MRAKFLSTAAILLALSYPVTGITQTQPPGQSQQQMQQIQQQLQQAEQALQAQDEQGAEQALDHANQSIEQAMEQGQGQRQQMLTEIQQQIQRAQQALQQRDQQGATQALALARQSSEQPMTTEQQAAEGSSTVAPADGSETTTAVQQESLGRAEQEQAATGQGAIGTELQKPVDTEEIIGQTALSPEGQDLGEIGDLVLSEEGEIEAAVIDVGGFLGIGERQVTVDWNKVRMSTETDQIVVNMTREELEAAPEYNATERLDDVVQ